MPVRKEGEPFDVAGALLAAFATNQRINLYLVENIPKAPTPDGKGRGIAAIVAHMHNVRVMWLKAAAKEIEPPAKLEREVSKADAALALHQSFQALNQLVSGSLKGDGKVKGFKPDVASFISYLLAHDAHHRGQISMLARQVGHPVPQKAMFGMWEWGTR